MKKVFYFKNIDNTPARRKLEGFSSFASRHGWDVLVMPADATDVRELLNFWHPIGCVVNSASGRNNYDGTLFRGTPVVFIDRPPRHLSRTDSYVYHDSTETVKTAMKELLVSSPKSCGYVGWPRSLEWDAERRREYERLAQLNGYERHLFKTKHPVDDNRKLPQELADWLVSLPKPAAVLAAADPMGAKVIHACKLAELNIPEDVRICGIDNDIDICESTSPTLSSVAPDHRQAGIRAGEILAELLGSRRRQAIRETYANPQLTRRQSTRVLMRSDVPCAAARELIRKKACDGLEARDVWPMLGCSRRNAEYRFRSATGMSILEAIQCERLERAKQLLRSGDAKLDAIANFCGYTSAVSFAHFFKKETGKSPREFARLAGATHQGPKVPVTRSKA